MAASTIRIVLAAHDEFFRSALALFLGVQDGFEVVGQATTSDQVLPLCQQLQPDVLFLDLELQPAIPLAFIHTLLQENARTAIIVLGPRHDGAKPEAFLQAGASEFLHRDIFGSDIADSIRRMGRQD